MKLPVVMISDMHLGASSSSKFDDLNFFASFLMHPKVKAASTIVFLGDTFDAMIGHCTEYYRSYDYFFLALEKLISKGVRIYFFEGNHDFHLEKLFETFFKIKKLENSNFSYHKNAALIETNGEKLLLAHGDDLEVLLRGKKHLFVKIVRSKLVYLLAQYIVPFFIINFLSREASRISKKLNKKRYAKEHTLLAKDYFRRVAEKSYEKYHFDFMICGHSHIADKYLSMRDFTYFNPGYASLERKFFSFSETAKELVFF